MRVLLLRRQSFGGIATHTRHLLDMLPSRGHDVTLMTADWIPDKTGPKVDKTVSERLKKEAKGYDLVHAFGYRCAWACGAAFGADEAWIYTAWDMPKTTHPLLISRLNDCFGGICVSRAVYGALDDAIAIHLETIRPGVPPPPNLPERAVLREKFRVGEDDILIGAAGRLVPERGFDSLIQAMDEVWPAFPNAHLVIAGEGPAEDDLKQVAMGTKHGEKIRIFPKQSSIHSWLGALDLFVTPSRRSGTSLVTLEAMSCGIPVLVRNAGGLAELIDEDISGMTFTGDGSLAERINEMLGLPLTLEAMSNAARVRVAEHFSVEDTIDRIERMYRNVNS